MVVVEATASFRMSIIEVVFSIQTLVYFSSQAERDLMVLDIKVKLQVSLQRIFFFHYKSSFNSLVSCLLNSTEFFFLQPRICAYYKSDSII